MVPRSDNGGDLEGLLRGLDRHEPPDIPLDAVFARWEKRRRRNFAVGAVSLAAGLLVLTLLRPPPEEPPVYIDLRVVDVALDDSGDDPGTGPRELSQP